MNKLKNNVFLATFSVLVISCSSYQDRNVNEQVEFKKNINLNSNNFYSLKKIEHKFDKNKAWLAGDHHIHGKYSAKWDLSTTPATPILRGDAQYATAVYAKMAKLHGLSWMVTTDHGGPNHSELNLQQAYPELISSRLATPEVLQFYGMEFDVPSGRHASLIIPYSDQEAQQLYEIEKNFNRREVEPDKTSRISNDFMLKALDAMDAQSPKPVLIINHPARQAKNLDEFTTVTPAKLRSWKEAAPDVVIGMEGAPGHQANALNPDGSIRMGDRGGYNDYPTVGGFDQMTATLGGFWDSMLGEGRNWWITSTSDSHMHYTEGRTDFWPGEYSKTYVYSEKNYDDVLSGLRSGHVFVSTGDLIQALFVTVTSSSSKAAAAIGETITVNKGESITINITFLDPESNNANAENPSVNRVDLIAGQIFGTSSDKTLATNPSTKVIKRFSETEWSPEGSYTNISYTLNNITKDSYIRVRGTNTNELEPKVDYPGENPWSDLWFYSNPIFIKVN